MVRNISRVVEDTELKTLVGASVRWWGRDRGIDRARGVAPARARATTASLGPEIEYDKEVYQPKDMGPAQAP